MQVETAALTVTQLTRHIKALLEADDILQDVLGEEPSWKERMTVKEMASYGLTEKDMYVEMEEEEAEEEEEPAGEE